MGGGGGRSNVRKYKSNIGRLCSVMRSWNFKMSFTPLDFKVHSEPNGS